MSTEKKAPNLNYKVSTFVQKCPTLAFCGFGLVMFLSPRFPPLFRSEIGVFFFLKRNDLQFFATRVRIRHGGDFPGIKITPQQAEALPTPPPCAKVIVAPLHNCKQHCDKHSILDLPLKNKMIY